MAESISQREIFGKDKIHYMAAWAVTEHNYDRARDAHLSLQDCMRHPIAFLSEMMGDIMHLHQALRQPDSRQFVDSVIKEINGHIDCKHWEVTPRADVPEDTDVLPSVWVVRCKHNLTTGEITKHKDDLLQHIRSHHHLVRYPFTHSIQNTILMVSSTSPLRGGLSTGSHQNGYVYGTSRQNSP